MQKDDSYIWMNALNRHEETDWWGKWTTIAHPQTALEEQINASKDFWQGWVTIYHIITRNMYCWLGTTNSRESMQKQFLIISSYKNENHEDNSLPSSQLQVTKWEWNIRLPLIMHQEHLPSDWNHCYQSIEPMPATVLANHVPVLVGL